MGANHAILGGNALMGLCSDELRLSRLTPEVAAAYGCFWQQRGKPIPPLPRTGLWITQNGVLVLGVGIYMTDGPYLLVEGLATNPAVPAVTRHRAVEMGLRQLEALGVIHGKTVFMLPSPEAAGVERIATRLGYILGRAATPIYRHPS